jgi:hypothetical protein
LEEVTMKAAPPEEFDLPVTPSAIVPDSVGGALMSLFIVDLTLPSCKAWVTENVGEGVLQWAKDSRCRWFGALLGPQLLHQQLLQTPSHVFQFQRGVFETVTKLGNRLEVSRAVVPEFRDQLVADAEMFGNDVARLQAGHA